jgi:hypothetical protein
MIPTMSKPKVTDPSPSQQSIMNALCRTPRLGENHRYRGLPRRIASDFLFVLFFGEQLDYRLSVGFLGHTV